MYLKNKGTIQLPTSQRSYNIYLYVSKYQYDQTPK